MVILKFLTDYYWIYLEERLFIFWESVYVYDRRWGSQYISLFLSWVNENICGYLMIAAMLQFNCLNACIMICYIQLMGPAGTILWGMWSPDLRFYLFWIWCGVHKTFKHQ
jgi:hypothetical protein